MIDAKTKTNPTHLRMGRALLACLSNKNALEVANKAGILSLSSRKINANFYRLFPAMVSSQIHSIYHSTLLITPPLQLQFVAWNSMPLIDNNPR